MEWHRSRPHPVRAALVAFLFALGIGLSGCVTIRSPIDMPPAHDGSSALLLIFHGYGDKPETWPAAVMSRVGDAGLLTDDWHTYSHDWSANSMRALTASRAGYRIGTVLGRRVAAEGARYRTIHLLGHSLGAFVMQGFVDAYRAERGDAYVHMTFLDPFLLRGWFGVGWGVRNFGRRADFAENYVVRGDEVWATNRYLRRAHNFDITNVVPEHMWEDSFGPHWWAVEFYRQSVGAGYPGHSYAPLTEGSPTHAEYPRGDVTRLLRTEAGVSVDR